MLSFLPGSIKGCLSFIIYFINTIFWAVLILTLAFLKLLIPIPAWRNMCSKILMWFGSNWVYINTLNQTIFNKTQWDININKQLSEDEWYMVLSNHQSWVDILVLQRIFNKKIPFLKFFLKKELIWVPILGVVWWALDYPFMKRYSKDFLKKHPELRGKDVEITKKACYKFKNNPVSVMNFVEGTRFTNEKHAKQKSQYKNLLTPKAGGIAFVLATMGDQLNSILNVTIVYPEGAKSFWEFLCGKVKKIKIRVESIPISEEIIGNYDEDSEFRQRFQNWLNLLWLEKDKSIDTMSEII